MAIVMTVQLSGCKKDTEVASLAGYKYGTSMKLGDGTARSFVELDASGNPKQIGVALSETAMNSLPASGAEVVLDLPAEGNKTVFKHILLGYMPHGHEPVKIYDQPHFDFHFYRITNAERLAITEDKKTQLAKDPEAAYLPTGHINGGPVPAMGVHWIDPTAEEFAGKLFARTFIYGSYDGQVIFWEPMITSAYIKATKDQSTAIKQPQKVQAPGYYPAVYSVRYNAAEKQYEISLDQLAMKQ